MAQIRWTTSSFIFVNFLSFVSYAVAQDQSTITCELPSQPEGSQATLTCDFTKTITASSVWIVYFYGWDLHGLPSPIYDHGNSQTHSSPYQMVGTVDISSRFRQITFNASRQTTGYYTCGLQDNKDSHPDFCLFNMSSAFDNKATASQAASISGTVATGLTIAASSKHGDAHGTNTYIIIGTLTAALTTVTIVLVAVVICRNRQEKKKVISTGNSIDQQDINGHRDGLFPPLVGAAGPAARNTSEVTSVVDLHMEQTLDPFLNYDSGIQISAISNQGHMQESKESEDFTSVDLKSTPNKVSQGLILKPFLDMIEEQWKLVQAKKTSEKHNSKAESLAGSDEIGYISNTDLEQKNGEIPERTPLCQRDIKPARESDTHGICPIYTTTAPKPRDWPSYKDLQGQSRWIVITLMPYVGCPVFPNHIDEAKSQQADLLEVKTLIKCRLDDLEIYEHESCSVDMAQLKESVIVKLKTAQKMADIRYSAITTLFTYLVKTEQRVKSAVEELSSLMGDSQ